jgi:TonB family protein
MMSCFIKRFLPFVLTLTIGVLLGSLFGHGRMYKHEEGQFVFAGSRDGGDHRCHHRYDYAYEFNTPAVITRKPEASYTAEARRKSITGVVKLRVTLSSDGTVSDVTPIEELPDGLTEEAMKAARRIEFKPAYVDGHPTDATQYVEYHFDANGAVSDGIYVSF